MFNQNCSIQQWQTYFNIYDFLDFFLLLFLQQAVLSLSSQGTWPLCTRVNFSHCAHCTRVKTRFFKISFVCTKIPLRLSFPSLDPFCSDLLSNFPTFLSGNTCCTVILNLGHRVGRSRTSLRPDIPKPLPFASNLMIRMIRIYYNDVDKL